MAGQRNKGMVTLVSKSAHTNGRIDEYVVIWKTVWKVRDEWIDGWMNRLKGAHGINTWRLGRWLAEHLHTTMDLKEELTIDEPHLATRSWYNRRVSLNYMVFVDYSKYVLTINRLAFFLTTVIWIMLRNNGESCSTPSPQRMNDAGITASGQERTSWPCRIYFTGLQSLKTLFFVVVQGILTSALLKEKAHFPSRPRQPALSLPNANKMWVGKRAHMDGIWASDRYDCWRT